MLSSALQGAPLAGAASFLSSLNGGGVSYCSLDHVASILGEGESAYVEVKGPLRFSDNGGGGDIKKTPAARLNGPDQSNSSEDSLKSRIEHTVLLLTDDMPVQVKEDIDRTMKSLVSDIERMWKIMTQNGGAEKLTLEQYVEHNLPQWVMNQRLQLAHPRYLEAIKDGRLEWKDKEKTKPCKTSNFFSSADPEKYAACTTVGTGRRFLKIEEDGLWRGTKVLFEGKVAEITRVTPSCWLVLDDIEHLRIPWSVERVDEESPDDTVRTILEHIETFSKNKESEEGIAAKEALVGIAEEVKRFLPQLVSMIRTETEGADGFYRLENLENMRFLFSKDDIPIARRFLEGEDDNSQIAGVLACNMIGLYALDEIVQKMDNSAKKLLPLIFLLSDDTGLANVLAYQFTSEDLPLVDYWVNDDRLVIRGQASLAAVYALSNMGDKIKGRAEYMPLIMKALLMWNDQEYSMKAIMAAGNIGASAVEAIPFIVEKVREYRYGDEEFEDILKAVKSISEDCRRVRDKEQDSDG